MRLRRDVILVAALLVAVVVVVVALALTAGEEQQAPPAADEVVALEDVDELAALAGRSVRADGLRVTGVPADEGFWVDAGGDRVWVQIDTAGESPFVVEEGERVSFVGRVEAHGPDFAERPEFSSADAEALREVGAHVEVDVGDLNP